MNMELITVILTWIDAATSSAEPVSFFGFDSIMETGLDMHQVRCPRTSAGSHTHRLTSMFNIAVPMPDTIIPEGIGLAESAEFCLICARWRHDACTIEQTSPYERESANRRLSAARLSEDAEESMGNLRVRDLMVRDPIMVESESTVRETAKAMDQSGHGCMLVTSGGRIVGIVTERDLVRRALAKGESMTRMKVKNIMSSPLIVVDPDTSMEEAVRVMAKHKVRRLPVVGSGGLAGLITVSDIARHLAEQSENSLSLFNAMARSRSRSKIYA